MTKSIARQLAFFTIAIVSSSIVYSAPPSLLSIEGVNPDGRYNQGDTVNITAKFDDFISTSPNSQMSVTLNVGPETVDVPLTFSATSLVDKSFGVPNTVNAKGKGDTSSEGIVMATELKVGANAGRIVVVGSFTEYENSGTGKAKMMVLNADGTIYKTFTSNSSSSFPHVAPQFDARNIQMVFETSEGKILVGGEFTNVWGDTAIDYLVQLNADFTLDTAFMDNLTPGSAVSSNGQVGSSGTYGSANYYSANTPVVEQDGKLYIAGDFTQIAGVTTRHIACLNLDGTFCSGFTSPFTGGTRAMSLAIDDDKLWVVGQDMTVSGAGTNVDVWRLNLADGSVDNTYVNRLTGDLVGGIVVLPEVADGGVGGVAISGNSLYMAAHTSSSNGGTAVSAARNKPLFVINDDGTQNTNWSVQGNTFAVNPWSGEGFQIVKDKLFFGMHYVGNDLSADDIRDAAGYYKSLNSTACPSNTANGNNSTSDTCGVSSLMVFNLNDGSINQEFMDIIKAQGSFIKSVDYSDDVHDFELLSDGGLLVVGSFSSYRATGATGDSADDEAMIVKFRFDQLSGSYTVRSPSNDFTGLVKSTGISSYQISNIFDSSNVDTDGNAAYANLVSTNQRFEDNTKYAFNRELANAIELYAEDNSYPVPTVQDYIDAGATGVTAANLDDVNAAIDSLVGADVDTLAEIQSVVNAVNTDSDSDGVNNFFDTCPGTPSGLVVNASGCPAVASAPTVNPTSGSEVSGTAQAGSTVEVKNTSGALLCTTVADSSGNYNCTPLSPVPSNGAVLSVTADNSAGPSAAATATVDSAAPNAPIILVSNAAELSGTAEANSTVTIKDASGAVVATTTAGPDGIYTFNPNPLIDGALGSAISTDAAGNESVPTLFGPVDAAAPTAPSVAVSNAGELSGTAEAGSTVTIKDASGAVVATTSAGPDGSYSFTPNPLADGQTGSVTAKDAAGNESPATAIGSVDATAPTAPVVAVSNAGELSGTAEANSTVTIKDASGAVVATTTAGPDGSYSFTPNPLADGQTGSVTAKDAAGNESAATAIGSVDATAPTAPVVAVSNAGELSGTAEANSTVTIKDASGAVVATTTAGPDGSYSLTPNPLADGESG
ncbi:Ig-like domain-containing protein, partial [Thalassolituus oleivorans]|uniref:Ig-like domain-containing protein n=1 Tax=Thalassolituus oleivorans TaxID=187493 RepID=UPI001CE361E0